ncbi:restriction endonuclease subunit S [Fusobacterium polymorphum]|uniref:Restriction endonuclease subunit S n=1 Tax=Fusobacterium nucleatum subsp. polymorphum TaxID=76857 RepID=A0A2C6CAZ4_FUSNP|nr:restriction endonuclease subunit S [Fusobacterium polymorphum]PHI13561.1 restriction endonuclease subunit S [Fusobacterium polymorphum]
MKIFNKSEWKKVKLGDICEVITGNTPSKKIKEYWDKDEVPFITPPELKYEGINYITPNIFVSKIGAKQGRIISKNSICVCCIGSLGKLGILKDDAITNQQINSLILKDKNIDLLYLYFYLKTIKNNLESIASSTTVKIINKSSFEKIEISLPNLEIQKKISKKLELLENNIDFRKNQLNYLKELNKSLFTRMFGDIKTNDKNWEIKKLGEVVQTQYGTSKKATSIVGKFPILRMNNITYSGEMDYKDLKYIELSDSEKEKFLLKKGELLFNRTNSKELVGKTGLFNLDIPMAFAGYLIRIKPSNLIHSKFLLFFMNSEFMKKLLYNKAKNIVGMANINAKELEDFSIILPPIELQNKFAERVEKIEKLKFEIEKSIEIAQNLYDSLISKYFDN